MPLAECARYIFRKYDAVLRDRAGVEFLGKTFYYDNRFIPVFLPNHIYEIQDLARFIDFKNVKQVLDIGANVGLFSYALKSLFPHIAVFSFEPNSAIFATLQKNASQFSNWKCFNCGLGVSARRLPFFFIEGKSAQGSIHRANAVHDLAADAVKEIQIQIRKLDLALISEIGISEPIDLIKIDVEGAEEEVLKGLADTKWRYLYIELSDTQAGGLTPEAVMNLIGGNATIQMQTEPEGSARIYSLLLEAT